MDYKKISDHEFEALAADVVGAIRETRLSYYASGPDGGIDASNTRAYRTQGDKVIIVQAKRYTKGQGSIIVSDAKRLVKQLSRRTEKPDALFLVTSLEISKDKQDEAQRVLEEFCEDSVVMQGTEVTSFLADESNRNILRKYVGLWMPEAATLQEMLAQGCEVDGQALLDEIDSRRQYYQATSAFGDALEICEKRGICLIVGPPGIGKTCLSHLLVAHFVGEGYRLRYTTTNDVASIKSAISLDPGVREVCLLDDFLGQRYYEMRASQPVEVAALARHVGKCHREGQYTKIVILNSRISIINEAQRRNPDFERWLGEYGLDSELVLDAEKLTRRDKTQLLIAGMDYARVSADHVSSVLQGQSYRKILDNDRFNPRVVERICAIASRGDISSARFVDSLYGALQKPVMVWRDEYENRLKPEDRTVLNTLFSLSDGEVDATVLKHCYEERVSNLSAIDPTASSFEACVDRLNKSMLSIGAGPDRVISVLNPSVNDYLEKSLSENRNEALNLIHSAVYADQVLRMCSVAKNVAFPDAVLGFLSDGKLLDMPYVDVDSGSCYLQIARWGDWQSCRTEDVARAVESCTRFFRGVQPVIDLLDDIEMGWADGLDENVVFKAVASEDIVGAAFKNWPNVEIPRYLSIARQSHSECPSAFAQCFTAWIKDFVWDCIDDCATDEADSVLSQCAMTDEDGKYLIEDFEIEPCANALQTVVMEKAMEKVDELFEGHGDVLEWLSFDTVRFFEHYDGFYDYEECIMQAAEWSGRTFNFQRPSDISDSEIEMDLNCLAERLKNDDAQ